MKILRLLAVVSALLLVAPATRALETLEQQAFTLPSVLSEGCVLQRNDRVPMWGKGPVGQVVQIKTSWSNRTFSTTVKPSGFWYLTIPTPEAGGPHTINLLCRGHQLQVGDVMIGEVWVCAGQSNMEMPLQKVSPGYPGVTNSADVIQKANNPNIRLFTVPSSAEIKPQHDCEARWRVCTADSVKNFSATGYFFGRELQSELDVPIGLISANMGGTRIESWMSPESLARHPDFKSVGELLMAEGPVPLSELQTAASRSWCAELLRRDAKISMHWKPASEMSADEGWQGVLHVRFGFELNAEALPDELELGFGEEKMWLDVRCNGEVVRENTLNFDEGVLTAPVRLPASVLKSGSNQLSVTFLAPDNVATHEALSRCFTLGERVLSEDGLRVETDNYEFARGLDARDMPRYPAHDPLTKDTASSLFNGMVVPIMPFRIRGVIWYQGESNLDTAEAYPSLFKELMTGWRQGWRRNDLSFYVAQIAPFSYDPDRGHAAALRNAQRRVLELQNTGLVSTLDIGNPGDIHPQNKQEVGRRFALWALARNYGREDLVYSGPIDAGMVVDGDRLRVAFDHAEGGLVAGDQGVLHVEVAGADGVYFPASTTFEGSELLAWSADVPKPVSLRYCHGAADEGTLFNKAGLPAPSFERP